MPSFEALVQLPESGPIPELNFHPGIASVAEDEEMTGEGIAGQGGSDNLCQTIEGQRMSASIRFHGPGRSLNPFLFPRGVSTENEVVENIEHRQGKGEEKK